MDDDDDFASVLNDESGYEDLSTSSPFEFRKGEDRRRNERVFTHLCKATPSKWDDAEKWLVSPSSGQKSKTKSGPIHHGHGGDLHLQSSGNNKKVLVVNHREWHSHPQPAKPGYEQQIAAILPNGKDTVLLVEGGGGYHHQNPKKMVSEPRQDDLPREKTKKMDASKANSGSPNFAFMPFPVPLSKGGANKEDFHGYNVVKEELANSKGASVSSHDSNNEEDLFLKPLVSRIGKPTSDHLAAGPYVTQGPSVGSVSMRDMGTEMTPIASQEPSRTGTPIGATTPTLRSPISSCPSSASSPSSPRQGSPQQDSRAVYMVEGDSKTNGKNGSGQTLKGKKVNVISWASKEEEDADASKSLKTIDIEEIKKNVLETRAAAWVEAEQAKYMARFKREEAKILAWENREKAKAEAEMRRMEVKVEKKRAQINEKLMKKLAAARQKAEESHAAAEAKRCERAAKAADRAEYIRHTGRLPSSFFGCGICN